MNAEHSNTSVLYTHFNSSCPVMRDVRWAKQLMDRSAKSNTRTFDVVGFVLLACLFAKGYLIALQPKFYEVYWAPNVFNGDYLEIGVLAVVSFLGIFYGFRIHTRLLWIIGAPLVVAVMPVFGNDIFMRLDRAPGEEGFVTINNPAELLVCYIGFLLCWFVVRQFGLRLRHNSNVAARSQLSLQELMAITAIAASLLFCYRHSVQPSQLNLGDFIGANAEERLSMVSSVLGLFFTFGGLITSLLLLRRRWLVISLLVSAIAFCCLWWFHNAYWRRYYILRHAEIPMAEFIGSFARFLILLTLPLIIVALAIAVARETGYQLTRDPQRHNDDSCETDPSPGTVH